MPRYYVEVMRTFCYNSDIGPRLFDLLNPVDLRSLSSRSGSTSSRRRETSTCSCGGSRRVRQLLQVLGVEGFWVVFMGPYLDSLVKMIKNLYADERLDTPMHMDMV